MTIQNFYDLPLNQTDKQAFQARAEIRELLEYERYCVIMDYTIKKQPAIVTMPKSMFLGMMALQKDILKKSPLQMAVVPNTRLIVLLYGLMAIKHR